MKKKKIVIPLLGVSLILLGVGVIYQHTQSQRENFEKERKTLEKKIKRIEEGLRELKKVRDNLVKVQIVKMPHFTTPVLRETKIFTCTPSKKEGVVRWVNLRREPTISSEIIKEKVKGMIKILADCGKWLKVKYQGQVGFMYKSLVKVVKEREKTKAKISAPSEKPVKTTPKPSPPPSPLKKEAPQGGSLTFEEVVEKCKEEGGTALVKDPVRGWICIK